MCEIGMRNSVILKDKIDRDLYRNISISPGIRISELSRKTKMHYATCRYRLLILEREGIIKIEPGRGNTKIYPKGSINGESEAQA
jgi:predicted transcriptional regulator